METIVIVVHLLVALAIIGLILMQQGKGAEAGASFGSGASQTVFGSQGGSNFFAKATGVLAFVFFATSFTLAIIAKENTSVVVDTGIPSISAEQPAVDSELPTAIGSELPAIESDLPVIESAETVPQASEAELPAAVEAANDSAPAK